MLLKKSESKKYKKHPKWSVATTRHGENVLQGQQAIEQAHLSSAVQRQETAVATWYNTRNGGEHELPRVASRVCCIGRRRGRKDAELACESTGKHIM